MEYFILFFILLISSFLNLKGQNTDTIRFRTLKPEDFYNCYLEEDSSILIDVREPFEYKANRIRGALNIPASGNLLKAADTINKRYRLFLYCTSGYRSSKAAKSMYDKGFRRLFNLEGGIIEWRKDGLPVEKEKVPRKARKIKK